MNIAFLLTPKIEVKCIQDDNTLRQGLEKMKAYGYSAIPVLKKDGKYLCTISQGDFLNYLLRASEERGNGEISLRDLETVTIKDIARPDRANPAKITEAPEDLVFQAMEQNFIPVCDDGGYFIGIVTRKDILKYLATSSQKTF